MDKEVVCKKCGTINEYRSVPNGPHLSAWCTACGEFIKHLQKDVNPMFHFGKYKGLIISECKDIKYLIWGLGENVFKGSAKQAVLDRIKELEG